MNDKTHAFIQGWLAGAAMGLSIATIAFNWMRW